MPPNRIPPGPKGRWIVGNLPEFIDDPLGFLTNCARTYGDVVRLAKDDYLLVHPNDIDMVLVQTNTLFTKGLEDEGRSTATAFPNAMMNSEGQRWLWKRRMIQPAFHRQRVATAVPLVVGAIERRTADWRDGETREIYDDMMALALESVSQFLFHTSFGDDRAKIAAALEAIMLLTRGRARAPLSIPTPGNLRLRRSLRDLREVIDRLIAEHSRPDAPADLLTTLLQLRDEQGQPWPIEHLRDELATLIMSGHETSGDGLTWLLYLLTQHPEVEQRVYAEIATLGDRPLEAEDLPALRYCEAVIKEVFRLYPPAWLTNREAARECEVGGYPVAAGATLGISAWVTHRDARWFAEPECFRPERWLDGSLDELPRGAYIPFGGGPRICVGAALANLEALVMLVTLARRFQFRLAPGAQVVPFPALALRPLGVRLIIRRRAG